MQIEYRNNRIMKICTDAAAARKQYGSDMARKIAQRIGEIGAADTVETMIACRIGRCHPLKGDRQGQYAADLVHPQRLVFTKNGDTVQVAMIEEIIDYH